MYNTFSYKYLQTFTRDIYLKQISNVYKERKTFVNFQFHKKHNENIGEYN